MRRYSGSGLSGKPASEPFSFLKRATRFIIWSLVQLRILRQSFISTPANATQFLEHCADRSRVLLGMALRHGGVVDGGGGIEERRRHAVARGEFGDDLHVLLKQLDLYAGVVVAPGHHLRAAGLEHAPRAGALADLVINGLRIEPAFHAERERLGRGNVVDRDQQVGAEFHPAAVPELAEVVMRAR